MIEENQLYKEGDLFGDRGMRSWSRFVKDIYELSSNIFDIQACRNGKFPSKVKRFPFFVLDNTRRKSLFGITVFLLKGS
ncbi:dTDP-4-dehydrorhamnose reductase [Bacteroides ovatus]|nr:dTDP-4-dehydrorhamnose reductase [Bacteroides ovatus]